MWQLPWVCIQPGCHHSACRLPTAQRHIHNASVRWPWRSKVMLQPLPVYHEVYRSVLLIKVVGWCFGEYTCLSVSNKPGTRGHRYIPLRVNKEFHRTVSRTGKSYTPVHLCRACLSLETDSVMREQSRHLWNHLNFKCMRWLCQWISLVTYCGII